MAKNRHTKLWGGRFNTGTHNLVESFNASIHFDQVLVHEDILGSLAHAAMLFHCQIIDDKSYQKIQSGLKKITQLVLEKKLVFLISDEDIHMNIERHLHHLIGDTAGKLHTARSRNDQVALDMHLYLRKQTLIVIDLLIQMQEVLLNIANIHSDTLLPGYTHLQRAQPIYLASHLLAYVSMFQRDIERLIEGWSRINQCPLGACALAGSTFPTNRQYVATLLDFDGIYLNTLDAVSNRDFVVEFLSAASLIMMHLSRLSEELILWSSQEFNFIRLNDAFCTGSSIMPQKKNPDVSELTRGKTGRVYGALMTLLTLLKGLPLAYNKDLQEDKEPLFDTLKTLKDCLRVYIPMLASTEFLKENMSIATQSGYLNATLLAEYLVKKGLPFRRAHEIVGKMVNYCLEKNCPLEALSLTEMKAFCDQIDTDLYPNLDTKNIAIHQKKGLKEELAYRQDKCIETKRWLNEKQLRLNKVALTFKLPEDF